MPTTIMPVYDIVFSIVVKLAWLSITLFSMLNTRTSARRAKMTPISGTLATRRMAFLTENRVGMARLASMILLLRAYCCTTTGFSNTPTFSTSIRTTSLCRSQRGGLRAAPIPAGVPVAITSPPSATGWFAAASPGR